MFEKLEYPKQGTRIEYTNGKLIIPDDPIIPFIRGDGTGPDIWAATQVVLDSVVAKVYGNKRRIHWFEIYAGLLALQRYGNDTVLPCDTVDAIQHFLVAIKGPLTTPVGSSAYVCLACAKEQNGIGQERPQICIQCGSTSITPRFRSLNVTLRQRLDVYACVRPVRWFTGVPAPVKHPERLNVVIYRENTEDVYAGIEFESGCEDTTRLIAIMEHDFHIDINPTSGIGLKSISSTGTKRLVRKAIRFAIDRKRSSVTIVHKGNIMKFTEGAFRDWGYEVAREEFGEFTVTEDEVKNKYQGQVPEGKIVIKDRIADQMFQQLLLRPQEYDVIATSNLNGDYLSDACAAQVGGLGMAPGANVGDVAALFEATHGTAPKYTNMDKVNPGSLILSGAMMLEHLGWHEAATLIPAAIEKTIKQKRVTYDLARQMRGATTIKSSEFGQAIVQNLGS